MHNSMENFARFFSKGGKLDKLGELILVWIFIEECAITVLHHDISHIAGNLMPDIIRSVTIGDF
jgi:hypothetical protein